MAAELAIVEPELKKAEEAVKNIDKVKINEVRKYGDPPQVVKSIMQGVCILMGKKFEWQIAQ